MVPSESHTERDAEIAVIGGNELALDVRDNVAISAEADSQKEVGGKIRIRFTRSVGIIVENRRTGTGPEVVVSAHRKIVVEVEVERNNILPGNEVDAVA